MTSKRETDELIERYCMGQLTPEELRIFEQWRESDPEMGLAVDEHRIITDAFRVYAERNELKAKIRGIQEEMETEEFRFSSPLKIVGRKETKVRLLWRRYRVASVAAIAAIVAVSATILTYNLAGVGPNKNTTTYQELRREVESIKRSQKAIIKDINSENKEAEPLPTKSFTGTGFALNQEGYILTSYHVIEDAKSVFVSNEKFEQLKVEAVYTDQNLDLAILKVDDENFKGFHEMPYSFKKNLADPGEKVFTLGYPREELVYGEGSISSYTGFEGDTASYQISIPVNPGNSGGPLFDNQANLLGIISGRNINAEGASFAVKSKWITDYLTKRTKESKINVPAQRNLKNLDRSAQIKKLKEYVFMVKVYN
jgi:S1-C subfamily serine protease